MTTIRVLTQDVKVLAQGESDFICLTDIARYKSSSGSDDLIRNWLRNRNTIEFLGIWERLNNPDFNAVEFDGFRRQAGRISPFERIKRTNDAGMEFWSSRDFAGVLEYTDYRNFEAVVEKAKLFCFNSGSRVEDHFVDVTEMIEIGKGGQQPGQVDGSADQKDE